MTDSKLVEIQFPIAVEFTAFRDDKAKGYCLIEVTPENAEYFERMRNRGAVSAFLVATFEDKA